MKRILVKVRRKHIQKGWAKECAECPVALAVSDAGFDQASVYVDTIWFTDDQQRKFSDSPRSVVRFIRAFDNGREVKPFNFYILLK